MEKQKVKSVLEVLGKAKGFEIFCSLEEPKRWSELRKVTKGDNKSLTNRINELIQLGLVEPILLKDHPKGVKAYVLTEKGKLVLMKLKEIDEILDS